jgi:hypothetical protein
MSSENTANQKSTFGFAEGLMQMSRKGPFQNMRLTRRRAEALLTALKEVIYYFPDCRCRNDDCHCHDDYFAGIYWIKQYIFRYYPDLSEFQNPTPDLFPLEKLKKNEANRLRDALDIADDHNDDPVTREAIKWAFNMIYKNFSIFDLAS